MKCEKSGNHTISYQSLLLSTTVLNDDGTKKGGQVTKPIIVVKICYKLLYVILVIKKNFDK